jgi:hypothetical protein
MIELAHSNHLTQVIDKPTRGASILDLCFTNCPHLISKHQTLPGISDHEAIMVIVASNLPKKVARRVPLFSKADFGGISSRLDRLSKTAQFDPTSNLTASQMWIAFKTTLLDAINTFVPFKTTSTKLHLPWLDRKLLRSIRKKQKLYSKAAATKLESDWSAYRAMRRQTDRQVRRAHWTYISDIIGPSLESSNPKPFWKVHQGQGPTGIWNFSTIYTIRVGHWRQRQG